MGFKTAVLFFCIVGMDFAVSSTGASQPANTRTPLKRDFIVNPAVKPCQDFYTYACSKEISGFTLREDRSAHTFSFSDASDHILDAQMEFLSSLGAKRKLSPRARELQDYFRACMNGDAAASEEKEFVARELKKLSSVNSLKEFQQLVARQSGTGETSVIDFGATPNTDDPAASDAFMLGDLMTLPEKSYYENEEVLRDFTAVVEVFFKTIAVDRAAERAQWVVGLEKDFAKTFPFPKELRSLIRSKTGISRADLLKKYPNLRFNLVLSKIPASTHIRELTPANFEFLNKALEDRPLDVWKSVYLFHALRPKMDDAYPAFFQKWFDFKGKHLGGGQKRAERRERCTYEILDNFQRELDAEVLPILFSRFQSERVEKLAERIRQAMIAGITRNNWLSPEAKVEAIKKMKTAGLQLVKPKKDSEWNFGLAADYHPDRPYFNSTLRKKKYYEKVIKEFGERRDPDLWLMSPLEVNAGYSAPVNRFVLPIGILRAPFFDPEQPDEVNLGAFGAFTAHELGHAIDSNGSRYDHSGRLRQWMSEQDLTEFRKRSAKLVSQFNAAKHDGELTLGENIADLAGLTFAFDAAFPEGRGSREEKQKFYLQYARSMCEVIRPAMRERALKTDPHAMGDARVNEQLKHQAGFQEAFGCKASDALFLPVSERVSIW